MGTIRFRGTPSDGGRFYLDDRQLRAGEALELATFGGGWVQGRFAVERRPMRPVLYVALSNGTYVHFVLPDGAELRRPAAYGSRWLVEVCTASDSSWRAIIAGGRTSMDSAQALRFDKMEAQDIAARLRNLNGWETRIAPSGAR